MAFRLSIHFFSSNILLPLQLLLAFSLLLYKANSQNESEAEKLILLQVSSEWGNPPALHDWNNTTSISYCSWTAISCTDGSVTAITLPNQVVDEPIPESICKLKNLTHLDLNFNNIPGTFPVTLYNCSNLQYLDLSRNLFVDVIPPDIYKLSSQLTYLDLSGNNFSGSVPHNIGLLPSIQFLHLYNNLFDGEFPVNLSKLITLETLTLAYNPFLPLTIPPEFGKLINLKYLWMSNMNLIGEIPETLGNLSVLEHLDLSVNSLHGTIPASIWNLEKLQHLYLFNNNLTGEILGPGAALGLIKIDLSVNQLTGAIPEAFGKLQNLTKLLLGFNGLSGEIPASIGLLRNLQDVRLFHNNLTGVLPPELGKHSNLNNFEVCNNRISGQLPEYLCVNQALNSLIVFNNNFTGEVPSSVANCSALVNIQLYNNNFSGDFPTRIWSAAHDLQTAIIHHNAFTGTLPDVLPWKLSRLELNNNKLSGRIPSSAPSLQVFKASSNLFAGDLPEILSGLPNLSTLQLGNNRISSSIPTTISSLKSLADLNLSYNKLTGRIPDSIGSLQLNSLDLSNNQLSGLIPEDLNNLWLSKLNLSYNQLSGEIPAQLLIQADEWSFLGNPDLCSSKRFTANLLICPSKSSNSKFSKKLVVIFLVLGGLFLLMTAVVASLYCKRRAQTQDIESWKTTSFSKVEINESEIVHGLISSNFIGRGGSGEVYKINLGNGSGPTIAVKKIFNDKRLDVKLEKQFEAEVNILSSIRHNNIVQLLSCISSTKSKLVVYEYVENGSLNEWIRGKKVRTESGEVVFLDWPKRLKIAIDAAEGLCYMHHHCAEPIVHRDVKSSNILLDKEFSAKIADFGLARMLVKAGEPQTVSGLAGTFGYMAPECGYSRKVNEKMDVYSFGVVLLELTTGRTPNDCDGQCIADWAFQSWFQDDTLMSAIDEEISDDPSCIEEIKEMHRLGIHCTARSPVERPTMKVVVQWLKQIQGIARSANVFAGESVSNAESYIQYKGRISDKSLSNDLSMFNV